MPSCARLVGLALLLGCVVVAHAQTTKPPNGPVRGELSPDQLRERECGGGPGVQNTWACRYGSWYVDINLGSKMPSLLSAGEALLALKAAVTVDGWGSSKIRSWKLTGGRAARGACAACGRRAAAESRSADSAAWLGVLLSTPHTGVQTVMCVGSGAARHPPPAADRRALRSTCATCSWRAGGPCTPKPWAHVQCNNGRVVAL